jgi:hypothetical protein
MLLPLLFMNSICKLHENLSASVSLHAIIWRVCGEETKNLVICGNWLLDKMVLVPA